jgi:protoporphyrinogen oxidase
MSAAYALSLHTDEFEVAVFDKECEAGGMATSVSRQSLGQANEQIKIDADKFGAGYINDGVQGCSPQL